jgi:hypothetical protein
METEGFLTKTDGSHTIGFAATDGFPRGLFIYHEHSSNDIIRISLCSTIRKDSLTSELP